MCETFFSFFFFFLPGVNHTWLVVGTGSWTGLRTKGNIVLDEEKTNGGSCRDLMDLTAGERRRKEK